MKCPDNQKETKSQLNNILELSTETVDNLMRSEKITAYSITKPVLTGEFLNHYNKWLKKGFNADMAWMERNIDVRVDLTQKFHWAKAVIMVADNYNFNHNRKPGTLKIARYAWGDDYHKVLEKKMKKILQKMMIIDKNVTGKIYVDTGPVMEKAFAVQSGLGWQGKNSTVLIPEVGSYCFLGTLIINKNIEYNQEKLANRCGDCNRCIQTCPTGALEEPYVLNANKCISYFSIEKKGIFSEQERQWLQNWLYGCDICQSVCPWNKKWAKNTPEISYYNRIHLLERSPKEWLDLTEEEFGKLFQKNVIKRLKFDRFRRNLEAALKNL